jgi:hypothetical protein
MKPKQVLIITPQQQRAAGLVDRIGRRGCRLYFAASCKSARSVLKEVKVDLVLSQMILPDGTADQILRALEGAPTDVFFANSLGDSAWWLHVLIEGRNHWWKPILLTPEQFSLYLDSGFANKKASSLQFWNAAACQPPGCSFADAK